MDRINLLKSIMRYIEKEFLKVGNTNIILPGYEYFRDVMTLYAKQNNLIESAILLMENGMNEEALIIGRSIVNNYFLISYILKDPKNNIDKYHMQPKKSQLNYFKNLKKLIKCLKEDGSWDSMQDKYGKFNITEDIVDENIKNLKTYEKYNLLNISKLAKSAGKHGISLYTDFYLKASRFEHSDITSLDIYKEKVLDEYSNNFLFNMTTDKTDENLKNEILKTIEISYFDSFLKIIKHIKDKESHLLKAYDEDKLNEIFCKVKNNLDVI